MTGPYRIIDRGDAWEARWGHAGWRYSLVDANDRPVILEMGWRRSRPIPVTGTNTLDDITTHAARLATKHGHNSFTPAPTTTPDQCPGQLSFDDL